MMPMEPIDYRSFLRSKELRFAGAGLEIQRADIHPVLSGKFAWQGDIVRWMLHKGRAACFADTGLGKTIMQVECARHVPGRSLIFAPLCVAEQTIREAKKLGAEVGFHGSGSKIEIVNYERLHQVDPTEWEAVLLDESSILKSVDGKTRTALLSVFANTPYRFCFTATPAPNDPTEIGNHAHFLGVMTRSEMLASFFVNRGEGNRSWDLKGHARDGFFKWLASWGCFIRKPSDLGYSDEGFELPPLRIHGEIVPCGLSTPGRLFADKLHGIQDRAAVRRVTLGARVQRAAEIVLAHEGQAIVWCGLNDEQDAMEMELGELCVSVTGAQSSEEKIAGVHAFLSGGRRILLTKGSIVGFGMNFQNADLQVFVGLSDSYEAYYQYGRRSWRYGQTRPVNIHVVLSDLEEEILSNVKRKERDAQAMQGEMIKRIAVHERAEIRGVVEMAPYEEREVSGDGWRLFRGDNVEVLNKLDPESIDLAVFSPPFADLYTYSASDRDMGNARNVEEFLSHFGGYLVPTLLLAMKPGRIVACHCQQIALQKAKHGVIGQRDFRGDLIRAFQAGGFIYHGEVTIDKNPQAQAIRTRTKGLSFSQLEKDAAWMRPALADYIILLRTPGDNAVVVTPDCNREEWIEWASPVWYHIRESDTLNAAEARSEEDEKHICALQLPTIRRCIRLWTNKGETVLDPFAGIGSTGYEAIQAGRKFIGIELKDAYAKVAAKNLDAAEQAVKSILLPLN